MGRLKPGLLHKQSLPSETEEIQRAEAGFLCADRPFNRPVKLILLYRCLSKINTKTYN
jgi:hypothetical protein